jgi:hypothetical protein
MSHSDRVNHNGHGHPHTGRGIVACELKAHAPFTALGALTGVGLMALVAVSHLPHDTSEHVFHVMHPLHVLFSAIVTAGLYWRYKRRLVPSILIGYVGSIGIGTLSDILLPHLGGILVGAEMHAVHIGFIDHWYIVNPLALAGVGVALWRPHTKLPHMGHVLLSTWASMFYLTAHGEAVWLPLLPAIFAVLFVAVWVPCCLSDIVFPLLFAGRRAAAEEVQKH